MKINYLKSAYQRPEIQTEETSFCNAICALSADGATISDATFEEYGEI